MTVYSTSTTQRFTDALLAAVAAANPTLAVVDGPPPASMLQLKEIFWIGDVNGEQDWKAFGNANRPKEEQYTVVCHISVISPTTPNSTETQANLNRRVMAILATVEQLLRANPTLGLDNDPAGGTAGYVVYSEVRSPFRLTKRGNDTTRESALEFGVFVRARL